MAEQTNDSVQKLEISLSLARHLLEQMDDMYGNEDGGEWQDLDAAAVADALDSVLQDWERARGLVSTAPSTLRLLADQVEIMLASATTFGGEFVEGYRIKTGALHRIIGLLTGAGHHVEVPLPTEPTKVVFEAWATERGYDTAGDWDEERKRHVFFNLYTAEIWEAWCAALGVIGHE